MEDGKGGVRCHEEHINLPTAWQVKVDKEETKLAFQQHGSFIERARKLLGNRIIDVETYWFEYPSLEQDLPMNFAGLEINELRAIEAAGMEYADDFVMLTPLDLCIGTGISPEKISAVCSWAETMIYSVHAEHADTVKWIKGVREIGDASGFNK